MARIVWITVSDRRFYPGTLAAVNSVLLYHPSASICVVSSGRFNEELTKVQVEMLEAAGVKVLPHTAFYRDGRVLGAWQLKAYAAADLCESCDVVIGFDSDAVLCGAIDDVIAACLEDGKFRGGCDGNGVTYGEEYAPYGFSVPTRNPVYMSTSLYVVASIPENRSILREWAEHCDKAKFGPQSEKIYAGHGDQGVLNAILFKKGCSRNVVLLDNQLWSQHWVYWSDVIHFDGELLRNRTASGKPMRLLHCGGGEKFWSRAHSAKLDGSGQNQVWSYAHWLRMLWLGRCTDRRIDPWTWLPAESRHLCEDIINYFHHIQAMDAASIQAAWEGLTDSFLSRCGDGVPRFLSLGKGMSQYILLARELAPGAKVVEIGSYLGGSVILLAIATLDLGFSIFSVESFTGNLNGKMDGHILPKRAEYIKHVKARYPFLNISCIPLDSSFAVSKFSDDSLDMVFIDANHETAAVTRDIQAWLPKVKAGGIIAGDDIGWSSVASAVAAAFPGGYSAENGIWWTRKDSRQSPRFLSSNEQVFDPHQLSVAG
jgi:predicted O-methyltransferase YrrM